MKSEKYILGLSCFYHDSSAVIIKGDEIIAAIQEERVTRRKFDNSFPINAINECLKIKDQKVTFDNPYGDGKSAKRIVKLLKTLDIDEKIIQKRITY